MMVDVTVTAHTSLSPRRGEDHTAGILSIGGMMTKQNITANEVLNVFVGDDRQTVLFAAWAKSSLVALLGASEYLVQSDADGELVLTFNVTSGGKHTPVSVQLLGEYAFIKVGEYEESVAIYTDGPEAPAVPNPPEPYNLGRFIEQLSHMLA